MKSSALKKSPLKKPPLRNPAQSLIEYKDELLSDKLFAYIMYPMVFFLWAGYEWARYLRPVEPMPIAATLIAVTMTAVCIPKIVKIRKLVKNINRGIEGEKSVGQFLEQFRSNGYEIFHDIPGDRIKGQKSNIDHVLIGPGGVFTVETKYAQKPSKGPCIIEKDGDVLRVNGREPSRNPIIQAKAQSRELAGILESSTGQKYWVQPIVVYPGWYIKNLTPDASVWVLNEGMIAKSLANSQVSLTPEKIHLAAYHLSRHIMSLDQR